jgi:hypothetical protein
MTLLRKKNLHQLLKANVTKRAIETTTAAMADIEKEAVYEVA